VIDATLLQVLSHPSDGLVAIVTQGESEPHVVNTWNSYVRVSGEDKLLIPVGGMYQTESNLKSNNRVKLTIGNREIEGLRYKGTGFLITGTARMVTEEPEVEEMRKTYPWLRAVLEVTIASSQQTL
jgi:hypothetical protein